MGKVLQFPGSENDRNQEMASMAKDGVLEKDVFNTPIGRVELVLKVDHIVYIRHDGNEYKTNLNMPEIIESIGPDGAADVVNEMLNAFVLNELSKIPY